MATLYDLNKMCKTHYDCVGCPLEDLCDYFPATCGEEQIKQMEDIIDKWVEEHKPASYLDDFKNKFPNARINSNGTPGMCVHFMYGDKSCECCGDCNKCWRKEMSEHVIG